jgi:hypothetical protein
MFRGLCMEWWPFCPFRNYRSDLIGKAFAFQSLDKQKPNQTVKICFLGGKGGVFHLLSRFYFSLMSIEGH